MLPKQLDENPAGDRTSNANAASGRATPAGRLSPSIPRTQKISAPRTTLRIKAAGRSADRRNPMFFDALPAFGRSVDRRGPTKPSAMEILQYGPTSSRTLENADDQNAIALLRQNLISTFTGCYRLGNIDAIRLRLQETDAIYFGQHCMASQT
jgi:hypothetical protein